MVDLFRNRHWDLVSKRGWYYVISALLLLVGVVALITNHAKTGEALNYGIDFKGGGLVSYRVEGELPSAQHASIIHDLRTALDEAGVESEIQVSPGGMSSSGDVIIVRTLLKNMPDEQKNDYLNKQIQETITPAVEQVLAKHDAKLAVTILTEKATDPLTGEETDVTKEIKTEGQEVVTGTVSKELLNNGILALILGTLLILGWIYIRYNIGGFSWRFAVASIIALVHDILTLIGMFALLHNYLQVNSPFIAALLTVLGFSIHDTIIIYDRIRENMRLRKGRTFAETVNISLLETLARSVNTVLTVLFTLLALFFFGGPTLRDFTAAMLIGVVVGAYSSIFVAGQLVVSWSKKQDKVMPSLLGTPEPALATAGAVPTAAVPMTVAAPSAPVQPQAGPDRDAIKRARQAGKTAKRKR